MPKQFGLILPGQQKKIAATTQYVKPKIFDESSAPSSDDDNRPQMKPTTKQPIGGSILDRRRAERLQQKAIEEDPTVYQYDEVYDDMETKRDTDEMSKKNEPRKPKYIERLLKHAERRKLESELRVDRQVQKERETEGEQFKDKDIYVTAAYRKRLEELRQMQEQERRDDYLEAIGDVTKQKDLDGFYRHLYEQKLGENKTVEKPNLVPADDDDTTELSYMPIKSVNSLKERTYRKRHASDNEDEPDEHILCDKNKKATQVHLPNNIDADSDFSIDSSSSSDEDEAKNDADKADKENAIDETENKITALEPTKIALNLQNIAAKDEKDAKDKDVISKLITFDESIITPKKKIDKTLIWQKRTIGEVFDEALKRYYKRRALRYGNDD